MISRFRTLYTYNAWANRETLGSLTRMNPPPPPAVEKFCHVIVGERLWYTRLMRQSTAGFVVWPDWNLEQCATEAAAVVKLWDSYLAGLTTEMLLHSVTYVNTEGQTWRNTVSDILEHVILHSAYHRAQVATIVRNAGGEPAYTDYIHAVRSGLLESSIPDAPGR